MTWWAAFDVCCEEVHEAFVMLMPRIVYHLIGVFPLCLIARNF